MADRLTDAELAEIRARGFIISQGMFDSLLSMARDLNAAEKENAHLKQAIKNAVVSINGQADEEVAALQLKLERAEARMRELSGIGTLPAPDPDPMDESFAQVCVENKGLRDLYLDLKAQRDAMLAALSPERALEIAESMEDGYGAADHLRAYALAAQHDSEPTRT